MNLFASVILLFRGLCKTAFLLFGLLIMMVAGELCILVLSIRRSRMPKELSQLIDARRHAIDCLGRTFGRLIFQIRDTKNSEQET